MKSKTTKRYYYCRHCNQRFTSLVMAQICFDLDMKILEYDKPDKQIPRSKKQSGSKQHSQ
jgi:transcriptional regulator NrdR family protein